MKTNTSTNDSSSSSGLVVRLREMPLDHALRRANLAALLVPDSHARKDEESDGASHTARWHITERNALPA